MDECAGTRRELLRYQSVLLRLGTESSADLGTFLQHALKATSLLLGVERVSFWRFESRPNAIRCVTNYTASEDSFAGGERYTEAETPVYFRALREELMIVVRDAFHDARLAEFIEPYLAPRRISSLLDVPVWGHGRLWGVVCHEHVGAVRDWQPEEQSFALSIGHLISVAVERDERQRLERALHESEERYSLLADTAKDYALLLLDPDGRIRAGAERIRGFSPDELTGKPLALFYPEQDVRRGRPERALRDALEQGRHEEVGWLRRRDGTQYWAKVTVSPLWTPTGELRGFASVTQDLTVQRLAEENARLLQQTQQEEVRQRMLARATAVMSSSLDLRQALPRAVESMVDGFAGACAVFVAAGARRDALLRVVARPRGDLGLLTQLAESLSVPEHRGPALKETSETGRSILIPVLTQEDVERLATDDASRALLLALGPASLLIVPIAVRDIVLGAVTFAREDRGRPFDADDLELAEEVGRRMGYAVDNARLYALARESIRVRDEFLSVAAHEFRTPLTSLKLQLQLIERALRAHQQDPAAEDERRHVELALRQVVRLTSLVQELLEISRVAAGKLDLRREQLDLGQLVRDVAELFEVEAARAGSTLMLQVEPGIVGRWDRERLEQVLTNLVANALRYGGGKPVELTVRGEPSDAFLIVKDQGIGIAPEDQGRIFDRFERAASSRHFGGLGLGLFISRKLIEAHGGTIAVASEPGRGSTFTVRLPKWAAAAVQHVELTEPEHLDEGTGTPVH